MTKKSLNQLSIKLVATEDELTEVLSLRKKVFVGEQGIPVHLELDDKDNKAIHFIAKTEQEVIGTCRLLITNKVGKIGRMAIKSKFRKQGIGSALIHKVINFAQKKDLDRLVLHAQLKAKDFYKKNGFKIVSDDIIEEAGINHLKMNMIL